MMQGQIEHRRLFGLDILRALAILMVLYAHGGFWVGAYVTPRHYAMAYIDGVSIFFVLSGFLIGGILIRTFEEDSSFGSLLQFWMRRWFRTLPNYYLILVLLLTIEVVLYHAKGPPASYFFFCQNLAWPQSEFFGESWSLSVEEWFYFTVPLILFVVLKAVPRLNRGTSFAWLMAGVLVFSAGARIYLSMVYPWQPGAWVSPPAAMVITRLDSIMLGCLLAWVNAYRPALWARIGFGAALCGLGLWTVELWHRWAYFGQGKFYHEHVWVLITSVGTALILPWISRLPDNCSIWGRFFVFTSKISYSIYLVHLSLTVYIIKRAFRYFQPSEWLDWTKFVLYLVLPFGIAYVLHRVWEKPIMNLRDRFKLYEKEKSPRSVRNQVSELSIQE